MTNLTFHGVGEAPNTLERGEEEVWLSPDAFLHHLDLAREHERMLITFDDGNFSDVDIALPALVDRSLKGTFFIIVDRIGRAGYLDREHIQALLNRGMEIGSHGMAHQPWRRMDERAAQREIVEAKEMLEEIAGRSISKAACPFGAYDRRTLARLRKAGFETVFTSDGGAAYSGQWLQSRNTLHRRDPPDCVSLLVANRRRRESLLPRVKRLAKRWR